ncbi:MAG: DUF5107 domain-containing protein [Bacteroidales bacterium]|nr:DUF5107 domain-containing protein [Bacteroidales bacterium]
MKRFFAIFLWVLGVSAFAQTVTVKDTVYSTYTYSDPDPVPQTGGAYPYHRYGTFAFEPVEKEWKMVVLENDWLRVRILPEIGGKIWSVYDKVTGKELFYDNDVVKFREIALRGPWTSGGIEFNYGIIGHAPSCAHPVDYSTEYKEDGSVSCYIGVMELLTRTRWMIEINLPKDAAYVSTRSFWHNYSGTFQPYYSWANSGVKVSDDMKIIYPASYTIGHDGLVEPYPFDNEGRDLSVYANQDFGVDKSYHPGGSHKNWFGAYWPSENFGMLHYALRDEKLGRKYFSWAQSQQGEIWVDLLTDGRPQYVELQSGRLFNQNLPESILTPYKQILFAPYATDEWSEYWLPFSGIGDVDYMNLKAAVEVSGVDGRLKVGIYPIHDISGLLRIEDENGEPIAEQYVELRVAEPFVGTFEIPQGCKASRILAGGQRIWSADSQELDRPERIDSRFSLESAQGQMIYGRYEAGMRKYRSAEQKVDRALEIEPALVPALTLKAMLCYRKMQYGDAYMYADRALAIDEYDPEANYIGGLAARKLGKVYDAMDRFELAALTTELRSAAQTQLAGLYFRDGQRDVAAQYARKSLVGNQYNMTAYWILYQADPSSWILDRVASLDPLCHFPEMERMLAGELSAEEMYASINEELKWQNYLEFAAFYSGLGLGGKAADVLDACPERNALVALWSAWLKGDADGISAAESCSVDLVFPFREESFAPLKWAVDNGGGWRSRYLLAMLCGFLGHEDEAAGLIAGDDSDYAPYYSYRGTLTGNAADMEKAMSLDPEQWRYRQNLALRHYSDGRYTEALAVLEPYYSRHRDNFHIGDTYVRCLVADRQYRKADRIISSMQILPFEGQSGAHVMYRDIKLHLAAECIDRGKFREAFQRIAEAKEWPSNLGTGKPYEELIDSSMENLLTAIVYARQGRNDMADEYLSKLNDADGKLRAAFARSTERKNGKYESVLPIVGDSDTSDRKLF